MIAPPADQPAARRTVARLVHSNDELDRMKGLLTIRLETENRTISGRAAWAAAIPDRLRVEWLNMVGQPVTRIVGDGQTISIWSYAEASLYQIRQSDSALESLVHIPIGVKDLIDLLAGRPALPPFAAAQRVNEQKASLSIELKNHWNRTLVRLDLDAEGRLRKQTAYNADGAVRYTIDWLQWQKVQHYTIPQKIHVEAADGDQLLLTVARFWPDAQLDDATFVFRPPDVHLQ